VNMAHGAAVDVLRTLVPGASLGAIHNRQRVLPEHGKPENNAAAALLDEHWNRVFPDPQILACYPPLTERAMEPYMQAGDMARICRPIDWFGLNHYGPIFAKADPAMTWGYAWGEAPADAPRSDIGWAIYPEMFRDELLEITRRYRLPIYVTENGCGGKDRPNEAGEVLDPQRIAYLRAYTGAMADAMKAGADLRGYFIWSLLDNFEWGSGYASRFGLVYVDYATQKRIPKSSSRWYAGLIAGKPTG
jgi:beta-glucosidase